jgi:surface protein
MPTTTGKIYLGSTLVAGGAGGGAGEWVRPSEWPALTIPSAAEQKVTGVYAVWPPVGGTDTTWLAMLFQGAYTVDWGDGSAPENVATNVKSEHQFDWANCVSAAVDVNLAQAGTMYYIETLGGTSQGDWNTLAGTVGATYGVGDSFNAAVAGSTLANSTGTVSTVPYRFATVSVVPQAGQNLTTVNLSQEATAGDFVDSAQWLDLAISAANCTSLTLRGQNGIEQRRVERVTIVAHAVTNMGSMFQNCSSLQSVPLFDTAAVTIMGSMFNGCVSLQSVPLFNTAAVTNMSSMFTSCVSLQSVPLFNTAAVTNMSSMFTSCSSLQSVPLFNSAAVTNTGSMFQNCSSLQSVPLFNSAAVTSMASMFRDCNSLQSVPLFNTAAVTNMQAMFLGCNSLQSVPLFDTAAVTNITNMFVNCPSLHTIKMTGTAVDLDISNCNLSAAALDLLYTNLADVTATPRTIVVTGNPGVSGHDPTIATAKGWTVTA